MQVKHDEKGPKALARGRRGIEYTLVPETEADQSFLREFDDILGKRPRRLDSAQIMSNGNSATFEKGKKIYSFYTIGLYEPAK